MLLERFTAVVSQKHGLKGQCHEIFDRFEFFRKFAEIFAAQGSPPVSLTPVANEKNFKSEKFK